MDTKRINQLPVADALTENTNVLIEADGSTQRIPADKIVPIDGADGQVLSYQDGKPVWVEVPSELPEGGDPGDVLTIQEDGAAWIPPAKAPENVSELANDAGYLTASDAAPHQQLVTDADGVAKWEDRLAYSSLDEYYYLPETQIEEDYTVVEINEMPPAGAKMEVNGTVYELARVESPSSFMPDFNDVFWYPNSFSGTSDAPVYLRCRAEDGVYVFKINDSSLHPAPVLVKIYSEIDVVHALDDTFLPTTVPVIQSASVGQTVIVKAVDENGKPTEWEAADAASGGGVTWINYLDTMTDDDGKQLTQAEFLDAFHTGKVIYNSGNKNHTGSCGQVIGYWINSTMKKVTYVRTEANGEPNAITVDVTFVAE